MKCKCRVPDFKYFSPFCYRATIEIDICQQSVVLLHGSFGTRCYIAVNRVRICAAQGTLGTAGCGIPTGLAMLLPLMETVPRTRLRT